MGVRAMRCDGASASVRGARRRRRWMRDDAREMWNYMNCIRVAVACAHGVVEGDVVRTEWSVGVRVLGLC